MANPMAMATALPMTGASESSSTHLMARCSSSIAPAGATLVTGDNRQREKTMGDCQG